MPHFIPVRDFVAHSAPQCGQCAHWQRALHFVKNARLKNARLYTLLFSRRRFSKDVSQNMQCNAYVNTHCIFTLSYAVKVSELSRKSTQFHVVCRKTRKLCCTDLWYLVMLPKINLIVEKICVIYFSPSVLVINFAWLVWRHLNFHHFSLEHSVSF